MKALSIIALVFAAFLIFLGVSSIASTGGLSYAVIIAGSLIIIFVGIIWVSTFIKERREK